MSRLAEQPLAAEEIRDYICRSIEAARVVEAPFYHLEFERVFPDEVYESMMGAMLEAGDYRPMSGRTKYTRAGGKPTRVKMDLLPEYIWHLTPEKRPVWAAVGKALCSPELKKVFIKKLAPALERRFGPGYASVGLYPAPLLTRDIAGYYIGEHTDTHWKGITVQFYLPPDESVTHIGTVFSERRPDGTFVKHSQMRFAPNTGYAFAVGTDTWHSVETVGPEVKTRDSILLTYSVDAGALRVVRNRFRRAGNMLKNEWRHWTKK